MTERGEAGSDVDLMAASQRGDRAAFERLVRRHERSVLATLRRLCGDATAADDLFQEVFVRVWRHRAGFRPGAAFTPWLYRIVRNVTWDFLKARRRERALAVDAAAAGAATEATAASAVETVARGEALDLVRDAVAELPERQREAVVLRFSGGLSYAEIAAAMNAPIGTVGYWINQALERLADRIEDPR